MLTLIKKLLCKWYLHYELITCVYMFEPWERKLINGIVLAIICLVTFSCCVYLPKYIETFLQFVSPGPTTMLNGVYSHVPFKIPIN